MIIRLEVVGSFVWAISTFNCQMLYYPYWSLSFRIMCKKIASTTEKITFCSRDTVKRKLLAVLQRTSIGA